MSKYITLLFSFLLIFLTDLKAQQLPLMTYYREQNALINPAILYYEYLYGENPNISASVSFRKQWLKVQDAPRTATARFEHIIGNNSKFYNEEGTEMLYGGSLINDAIGLSDLTGGYLRYAYVLRFKGYDKARLSMGMNLGYFQYRYKPENAILRQAGDLTGGTPLRQGIFDFSAGIYWTLGGLGEKDIFYGGVSVPQLLTRSFSLNDSQVSNRYQHYYLLLGYFFFLPNSDHDSQFFIEPSLWLRYVPNIPFQLDMNIRVNIDKFWVGAGASNSLQPSFKMDIMHAEFGVQVPTQNTQIFKVGYGFDMTTNNASSKLGSTHEINLIYIWGKSR